MMPTRQKKYFNIVEKLACLKVFQILYTKRVEKHQIVAFVNVISKPYFINKKIAERANNEFVTIVFVVTHLISIGHNNSTIFMKYAA
jgi:hypothetical protein